jgi:hypothetical protein
MNRKHNTECTNIKNIFPDYLTGDLEPEMVKSVQQHTEVCDACCLELEELTTTWTQLGVLPEEQPGPNLRKNFYTMLESYKEGLNRESTFKRFINAFGTWLALPQRAAYQMAFAVIILITGFAAGFFFSSGSSKEVPGYKEEMARLSSQVEQMRGQLVLALLNQSSPGERLKGISWTSTMKNPDEKTIDSLLQTLNNDPDVNVRLSVVDALYLFSLQPKVKEGIIESLPRQSSPLVQVALIDLMMQMREKQAVDALKQLIQKNKLNPDVKERAKAVMEQMI